VLAAVEALAAQPVTETNIAIPARALANSLAAGCVGKDVDGFVYDRPLFVDSLPAGQVTVGAVIDRLAEPGPPALVTLTGREIGELLEQDAVKAEWRRGVGMMRMPMNREFRVMTTTGFLARHRAAARRGFELDQTPLWERAVEVLGRAGGR
jgi:hypothetical protein